MSEPVKRLDTRMPEAEVTLRLSFWLLDRAGPGSHADIAIDGAHVRIRSHEHSGQRIKEQTIFDIRAFLQKNGCNPQSLKDEWRGSYTYKDRTFKINSVKGFDVQAKLGRKNIKVECKGGPLRPIQGKSVNAIFAQAIGQVIVSGITSSADQLWVAVPDSRAFESVGRKIAKGPAFRRTGIRIALVGETGQVRLLT
ncbi:MAG: hypothetical protein HY647_10050 [Acidobacteria bacterium]|nr:hypothetical protein [Acidobacteriota bacterium]